MGRKANESIRQFYIFDAKSLKSICKVCNTSLSGRHMTNLKRHLEMKHASLKQDYLSSLKDENELPPKKIKISYEVDKDKFIDSLVKIVSKDGRPFVHLESEGFQEIVTPIFNCLEMTPINSRNIMEHVNAKVVQIKNDVRKLVSGRLISIKIDSATRLDRSILGVNLQVIARNPVSIVIKTIGMVQLDPPHTGIAIKEKLKEILQDFGINIEQIYSITTDNGRNMIKMVECLNAEIEDVEEEVDGYDDSTDEILNSISFNEHVFSVRCAAHTLQLAVTDFHKEQNLTLKIETARKVVKKLRTSKNRLILQQNSKIVPPLDVETRWNSTYNMLEKLLALKTFLFERNVGGCDVDWQWVESYVVTLEPIWIATKKLQMEQLILSDLFKIWMELKLKYEADPNEISKKILVELCKREHMLLENDALISAVYLDPRLNVLLSPLQKSVAKQNLKRIAKIIMKLNQNKTQLLGLPETNTPGPSGFPTGDGEHSLLNTLLNKLSDQSDTELNEPLTDELKEVFCEIDNFQELHKRLPINANVLTFFEEKIQFRYPRMFELALVILGVPATQVSVERAFSALHFILSEKRYKLGAQTLENLLLVKLNSS